MRKQQRVLVKVLSDNATVPTYAHTGDSGFDLYASEDAIIEPRHTVIVATGLAFGIPAGYEIQLRPRSGISAKHKLRIPNAPGTVDTGYRGEVGVIVENTSYEGEERVTHVKTLGDNTLNTAPETYPKGTYIIRKGDRIVQGVLAEVPHAMFEVVDDLGDTERGDGGFGSSGVSE